jgi:hypothetical protein
MIDLLGPKAEQGEAKHHQPFWQPLESRQEVIGVSCSSYPLVDAFTRRVTSALAEVLDEVLG